MPAANSAARPAPKSAAKPATQPGTEPAGRPAPAPGARRAKPAKTQPTRQSVEAFLAEVPDARRRDEARQVLALMAQASGEPAVMWGPSIIGFGRYHYRYASGHEGDSARMGFSPRKAELVLYLADGFEGREAMLARLGPPGCHRLGKSCLYIRHLAAVDGAVLAQLIQASWQAMQARHPPSAA